MLAHPIFLTLLKRFYTKVHVCLKYRIIFVNILTAFFIQISPSPYKASPRVRCLRSATLDNVNTFIHFGNRHNWIILFNDRIYLINSALYAAVDNFLKNNNTQDKASYHRETLQYRQVRFGPGM